MHHPQHSTRRITNTSSACPSSSCCSSRIAVHAPRVCSSSSSSGGGSKARRPPLLVRAGGAGAPPRQASAPPPHHHHHHSSAEPGGASHQQAASPQQPRSRSRLLPDEQLMAAIRACDSWAACEALLQQHAPRLDAMLLSALATHAVRLHHRAAAAAAAPIQPAGASLWQQQQQQHSTAAGESASSSSSSESSSSSSSRRPAATKERASASSSCAAASSFLRRLSDVALASALRSSRSSSSSSRGGSYWAPQQYSNVLYAFAKCGHRLPPAWTHSFLTQALGCLHAFRPRELAMLAWAAATLRAAVPSSFVARLVAASAPQLASCSPQDIANTLWALARLGAQQQQPPPAWRAAAAAAVQRQAQYFKPHELSITIWAASRLRVRLLAPPAGPLLQHQGAAAAAAAAGDGGGEGGGGSSSSSSGSWLLLAIARAMPLMGLQEVANLLWGLATGQQAALAPPQLQAVANQALLVLAQSATRTQAASAALTVCLWSLARLRWAPGLPQARLVVRLLSEALSSGTLDMHHVCVLLWSLARLRLRPPAAAMHHIVGGLAASGMQSAAPTDACQVLSACCALGWRPAQCWWAAWYRDSSGMLRAGSACELVGMLSASAALRPLHPPAAWWAAFWESMGVELEAAAEARGLARVAYTRNLPRGSASVAAVTAAFRAAAAAKAAGGHDWQPSPWLHMHEALHVISNLQALSAAAAGGTAPPSSTGGQQQAELLTTRDAVLLLWSCARLRHSPPPVLTRKLLLLLLADAHALQPRALAVVLWSLARLLARPNGAGQLRSFALVKALAMAGQWRLLVGCAGAREERQRLASALCYLAAGGRFPGAMLPARSLRRLGLGLQQGSSSSSSELHVPGVLDGLLLCDDGEEEAAATHCATQRSEGA